MPRVSANDIELHYEETGSGPEALVLVHGWTGNLHVWDGVMEHLPQDGVRVVAFDLRGAGLSDRPPNGYDAATLAEDIAAATANLGLQQFSFAGHSLGGAIGMQLALNHPHRLGRLMLVAPAPSAGMGVLGEVGGQFYAAMCQVYNDAERHVEFLLQALTARQLPQDAFRRLISVEQASGRAHLDLCWQGLHADISALLPKIATPALVIAGDRDILRDCNLQDHARIPGAALQVFYRVGHMVPWEVPEELAGLMTSFIEHGVAVPEGAAG
jgi:pimeloyl-ACP methyl ester carboxylesterase